MHRFGLIFDKKHKRPLVKEDYECAGIEGLFRDVSLDLIPKDAPYYGKLSGYIDTLEDRINNGIGLILAGEHGGGKSAAAVIVVKEVISRGGSSLFIEEDALIGAVLKGDRFGENSTYLERARNVDLLVIDDLGLSATSDNLHIIEPLVKFRLRRKRRPTVLTTNLKVDSFRDRYPTLADLGKEAFIGVVCRGVAWRDILAERLKQSLG